MHTFSFRPLANTHFSAKKALSKATFSALVYTETGARGKNCHLGRNTAAVGRHFFAKPKLSLVTRLPLSWPLSPFLYSYCIKSANRDNEGKWQIYLGMIWLQSFEEDHQVRRGQVKRGTRWNGDSNNIGTSDINNVDTSDISRFPPPEKRRNEQRRDPIRGWVQRGKDSEGRGGVNGKWHCWSEATFDTMRPLLIQWGHSRFSHLTIACLTVYKKDETLINLAMEGKTTLEAQLKVCSKPVIGLENVIEFIDPDSDSGIRVYHCASVCCLPYSCNYPWTCLLLPSQGSSFGTYQNHFTYQEAEKWPEESDLEKVTWKSDLKKWPFFLQRKKFPNEANMFLCADKKTINRNQGTDDGGNETSSRTWAGLWPWRRCKFRYEKAILSWKWSGERGKWWNSHPVLKTSWNT